MFLNMCNLCKEETFYCHENINIGKEISVVFNIYVNQQCSNISYYIIGYNSISQFDIVKGFIDSYVYTLKKFIDFPRHEYRLG